MDVARTQDHPVSKLPLAELPLVGNLDALFAALAPERTDDVAFRHAPAYQIAMAPEPMQRGVNVFGAPRTHAADMPDFRFGLRAITSVVLNDGFCSSNSLSILDAGQRLFWHGIENISQPERLASYDPSFTRDSEGGRCLSRAAVAHAPMIDVIAVPICAAGWPNYGHFLIDGLPAVYMLTRLLPGERVRLIGQGLRDWQRAILQSVGLEDRHLRVQGLMRFRKILATSMLALHLPYPTAFVRPLFDSIRFRFGTDRPPTRKLFVSRRGQPRRQVVNREALEALAVARGFEIVLPETLPFADQVRLFAEAGVVAGESGAAMANIGFCPPGAAVLEVQTARFGDSWLKATCFTFGHRWHVFQGVDIPKGDEAFPPGDGVQLATHVDPEAFAAALDVLVERAGLR